VTRRSAVTAVVFALAIVGALLMGGYEMNHPASNACQPIHPELAGADYSEGVWTRGGTIIGFSLEEDSVIVNDADCV
jgi:hypothetical protein